MHSPPCGNCPTGRLEGRILTPVRVVRNLAMVPPSESAFTAEFLIRSMDIISL
jgi:hypothetical protein